MRLTARKIEGQASIAQLCQTQIFGLTWTNVKVLQYTSTSRRQLEQTVTNMVNMYVCLYVCELIIGLIMPVAKFSAAAAASALFTDFATKY